MYTLMYIMNELFQLGGGERSTLTRQKNVAKRREGSLYEFLCCTGRLLILMLTTEKHPKKKPTGRASVKPRCSCKT